MKNLIVNTLHDKFNGLVPLDKLPPRIDYGPIALKDQTGSHTLSDFQTELYTTAAVVGPAAIVYGGAAGIFKGINDAETTTMVYEDAVEAGYADSNFLELGELAQSDVIDAAAEELLEMGVEEAAGDVIIAVLEDLALLLLL